MGNIYFKDRYSAGKALAEYLMKYKNDARVIVLAIPRGGVPVGYEVSQAINAPLDVFIVRKLGVPGQSELAMGALASGGSVILNDGIIKSLGIEQTAISAVLADEEKELHRRERLYRKDLPPINIKDKIVLLVDDGLATGASMRAACAAVLKQNPLELIVAVPVAASDTCLAINDEFKNTTCICTASPEPFNSVGKWYRDFHQIQDKEVIELLEKRRLELT